MRKLTNRLINQNVEWLCAKISFIFIVTPVFLIMLMQAHSLISPVGLARIINLSTLFASPSKAVMIVLLALASITYLLEYRMFVSSGLLFILMALATTLHESYGIHFRATILSTVFLAQAIAYGLKSINTSFNLELFRIQYPLQLIAATYTLAGFSKVWASGFSWFLQAKLFSLQVVKNYSFIYFDTGNPIFLDRGFTIAHQIIEHYWFISPLLAISLFLELCCMIVLLVTRRFRIYYGLALLLMHFGIDAIMGIGMGIIVKPMIVFFINPLYLLVNYFKKEKVIIRS